MRNEKILGVFPIDTGEVGPKRAYAYFNCYDAYFTNERIIGNFTETRSFTRFYGNFVTKLNYGILDSLVIVPLTQSSGGSSPTTDPDQILKSNEHNFAWDFKKDIETIEFKRRWGWWGQYLMLFKFYDGKEKMVSYYTKHAKELLELCQEIAPDKIVVRKIP